MPTTLSLVGRFKTQHLIKALLLKNTTLQCPTPKTHDFMVLDPTRPNPISKHKILCHAIIIPEYEITQPNQ